MIRLGAGISGRRIQAPVKLALPVGAMLGITACATLPEGISEQQVADYTTAAASIGCVLKHDSDYVPVEFQAGLTREQTQNITVYMLSTDRAGKLPDGGVRLTTGACA